jgi:hypothetical protein
VHRTISRQDAPNLRVRRLVALFIDVAPFFAVAEFSPFSRYGAIPLVLAYRLTCDVLGSVTVGKRLAGLEVRTSGGAVPTRMRRVLREAPYLVLSGVVLMAEVIVRVGEPWAEPTTARAIPAFLVLSALNVAFWDFAVALFSKRSSLHDFIARTTVCLAEESASKRYERMVGDEGLEPPTPSV